MVFKHKQFPLIVYFLIWVLCVAWFWIFVKGDALGYAVLVFWAFLPLTTIFSSCLIGYNRRTGKWKHPILFGILHMLADYATFKMANNLANHTLNPCSLELILPGAVCSVIGLLLGSGIYHLVRKRRSP